MKVLRGSAASPAADREVTADLAQAVRESGRSAVRVWYPPKQVAFGRRDRLCSDYELARREAADRGYSPIERDTGGRAVAFTERVLACCRIEPVDPHDFGVDGRYDRLLADLESACAALGVQCTRGEPPLSFCPGTRSLQAGGKVAGLAQRIARGVAIAAAVLVVADADAIADVLVPVYEALNVAFDPSSLSSLQQAGCAAGPSLVRSTVEDALVGDADPAVTRVRDT